MGVLEKKKSRNARKIMRIRKKISGTQEKPRLAITQSNQNLYAQAVNDLEGKTMVYISTRDKTFASKSRSKKNVKTAEVLAEKMAEKLSAAKIKSIVLDRRTKNPTQRC